jgi:hypothetical protein
LHGRSDQLEHLDLPVGPDAFDASVDPAVEADHELT